MSAWHAAGWEDTRLMAVVPIKHHTLHNMISNCSVSCTWVFQPPLCASYGLPGRHLKYQKVWWTMHCCCTVHSTAHQSWGVIMSATWWWHWPEILGCPLGAQLLSQIWWPEDLPGFQWCSDQHWWWGAVLVGNGKAVSKWWLGGLCSCIYVFWLCCKLSPQVSFNRVCKVAVCAFGWLMDKQEEGPSHLCMAAPAIAGEVMLQKAAFGT